MTSYGNPSEIVYILAFLRHILSRMGCGRKRMPPRSVMHRPLYPNIELSRHAKLHNIATQHPVLVAMSLDDNWR